jgi:hypothetical protein
MGKKSIKSLLLHKLSMGIIEDNSLTDMLYILYLYFDMRLTKSDKDYSIISKNKLKFNLWEYDLVVKELEDYYGIDIDFSNPFTLKNLFILNERISSFEMVLGDNSFITLDVYGYRDLCSLVQDIVMRNNKSKGEQNTTSGLVMGNDCGVNPMKPYIYYREMDSFPKSLSGWKNLADSDSDSIG